MSTMTRLPDDDPRIKAWECYRKTDDYQNTLNWVEKQGGKYGEGSLWSAFVEGWIAAMSTPADTAEAPKIQHILSRDQRDALVAANVFLVVMQDMRPELFNRIQGILDEISDMLYG